MCCRYYISWALALFMAISLAGGQPKKLIILNTIECVAKNNVFTKVVCQLYSRMEFNAFATLGEKKDAHKVLGICDVELYSHGQKKITRVKNMKLDFCQLNKYTEKHSILGTYYQALRRSVVGFPKKCPFKKNNTYSVNRFYLSWQDTPQYLPEVNFTFRGKIYVNDELGIEAKVVGGFTKVLNESDYWKPLKELA